MPTYVTDADWGVAGTFFAQNSYSLVPSKGNATIDLKIMEENGTLSNKSLITYIGHMDKEIPIGFSFQEINEYFGSVSGKYLHMKLSFYDWILTETQNATATIRVFPEKVFIKVMGRNVRTFKPGHSFPIHFAVTKLDGSPYSSKYFSSITITTTHIGSSTTSYETKQIIPDDSVVKYTVQPRDGDTKISIRAYHESGERRVVEVECFKAYSPSQVYLRIQSSTTHPAIDEYMIFTLKTNVYVKEINYVVMGTGNILVGSTLQMDTMQKSFSLALSREMAPSARLVAYFIHNGEVVADALNFHIDDTKLKTSKLIVNTGKDFSRDTIEVIVTGPPGGFAFVEGAEITLWKHGAKTFFTQEMIEDELSTYDEGAQGAYHHIWHYRDEVEWEKDVFFNSPSTGLDTLQTFEMAGLYVFGDMNFTFVASNDPCNETIGLGRCPSTGECFELARRCDGMFDCVDGYDETACPEEYPARRREINIDLLQRYAGFFVDIGWWLWKPFYIMPYGAAERTHTVPKNKYTYAITGFVLHPEDGLHLVDEPTLHTARRDFFMLMNIPSTSRRGEQIGIQLSLFNYNEERVECLVMLHGSPNYKFVVVEEDGIVSSYNPRTVFGDVQTMVVLEAGEQRYLYMPFVPTINSGQITVRVSAFTVSNQDYQERTLEISYDGITNDDYTPYLIDLVNQGSVIIPDFDSIVPDQFIDPTVPYHLYIPGSESAVMSIFGDLVLPDFSDGPYTLNSMMRLPHDSAEGYIFEFHMNLQMLYFLRETNALSTTQEGNIIEYLNNILMRLFAYMYQITDDDGDKNAYFKQFRRVENPSIWVTSTGLRALSAMLDSHWAEQVYISHETVNELAIWLCKQQQGTGVWKENGPIYDRNMQPFSDASDGFQYEWDIPLTTHVTVTLAKITKLTGSAKGMVDRTLLLAGDYLASTWPLVETPTHIARVAYTLSLLGHIDKDSSFFKLHSARREDNNIYWSNGKIEPRPFYVIDTVTIMSPQKEIPHLGEAVMATSYALLLYLQRQYSPWPEYARSIMNFLNDYRDATFGFQSSQDTLIAFEALAAYALNEKNRFIYQMDITIESTYVPGWSHHVNFTSANFAKAHRIKIPDARGQLKARAKGTGYAFMMLQVKHNVEYQELVREPNYDSFAVSVDDLHFTGRNSSVMHASVCVRWLRTDLAPQAGQSFVTTQIPTGYVINRDAIMDMYHYQSVPGLKRVRFRDDTLILIFEYVANNRTCVRFWADRWYPVANATIQYRLGAWEYTETGLERINLYNAYQLFHQHICQVCGSFQCPYCPYYNAGNSNRSSYLPIVIALISMLVSMIVKYYLQILWNTIHK